jgi:S1-C subfamily serine protease
MKFVLLALLAWVLLSTHSDGPTQSGSVDAQRLAIAKIRIQRESGFETGAAIYVGNDQLYGYFVTAYHTIDPGSGGKVKSVQIQLFNSPDLVSAEVVDKFDATVDLGIIKTEIRHIPSQIKQLIPSQPTPATEIRIIGHPAGGDWSVWSGRIENENAPQGDFRHFIVNRDNSLTRGYSGGGVFDANGNFLGMHLATTTSYGRNLKSREIVDFLGAYHVPTNNFGQNVSTTSETNPGRLNAGGAAITQPIQSTIQFSASNYNVNEAGGYAIVTVTRSGDAGNIAGVTYSTSNGTARADKDYVATQGVLNFSAGEVSRTFSILVVDNGFVDGARTVKLALTNPFGGVLAQSTAVLTIIDDELSPGLNPLDAPRSFVQYQYYDFLGRYPEKSGWDFWTNQLTNCGSNAHCAEMRVTVSAAFFLSIEFQQTGYLVERFYKVAYGNRIGHSTLGGAHALPVPIIRFDEFQKDTPRIGGSVIVLAPHWEQLLETNKQAYALEFVQTPRFVTAFPTNLTPAQFVDQLNQQAGNVLSPSERQAAINLFGGTANSSNPTPRAQAVRQVADDPDLYNAEFSRAFVLSAYFGYLRRNPDDAPELDYTGYEFWLTKLSQAKGNFLSAEIVKGFLSSSEYRQRFGP